MVTNTPKQSEITNELGINVWSLFWVKISKHNPQLDNMFHLNNWI